MEWSARRRSGTSDKSRARKGRRRCSLSRKSRGSCLEAAGGEAPGCSIYNWRVQKSSDFVSVRPLGQGCPILLRVDCARKRWPGPLFSLNFFAFFYFSELSPAAVGTTANHISTGKQQACPFFPKGTASPFDSV